MGEVVGAAVRRHRLAVGLTQQELAERAGMSVRGLRDLEQGRIRRPRARSVHGLAEALALPAAERDALVAVLAGGDGGTQPVEIGVLGRLVVSCGGRRVEISSQRRRALLGLLCLYQGEVVPTTEIIDVLWDERPPRTARNLVQMHVGGLRALLGVAGRSLRSANGGYLLDLAGHQLDLVQFDDLVTRAQAARAAGHLERAAEHFMSALRCWRGPVLADAGERLRHHPAATAASQRRIGATLAFADLAVALDTVEPAIVMLRALTHEQPLHDGLHGRLILALAAAGERAEALGVYAEFRTRLIAELGVEPAPEVQAVHLRILRRDAPDHGLAGGPDTGAVPVPAQLPAAAHHFTGRREQLATLDTVLDERGADATSVCLITGTAGVGKTALAVYWAHRRASRFPDGQLYVNLRGYAAGAPVRPIEALGRLLRSLGVDPAAIPLDVEEAAALYRSQVAGRRILVLLDNAASVEQVRPLLAGSDRCTTLVTGRGRLGGLVAHHGARLVRLDVLAADEAYTLLERVLGAAVVAAEPAATRELAQRCAFLPLALRVAAANVIGRPFPTIAEFAAELAGTSPLSALSTDGDELAAVRAAIDPSYVQLPADAQRLFRLLSLVPGPDFGVAAVAALAGLPATTARRTLDRLCAAHLVTEHRGGRYSLHDLLRSYAAERARSDEPMDQLTTATRRLVDFYVETVHEAFSLLLPRRDDWPRDLVHPPAEPLRFADRSAVLHWHDQERENLVGAVRLAAENGWHASAWQLADSLFAYFHTRRHWPDWLAAAGVGLASARQIADRRAAVRMHNALGVVHKQIGDFAAARRHYRTALRLAEQIGYDRMVAGMHVNLGGLAVTQGDPATGVHHLRTALTSPDYGQDPRFASITYVNLGSALVDMDRHAEATEALSRALEMAAAAGDVQVACFAHHNLAEVALRTGAPATARMHAEQQLRLAEEAGDPMRQAAAHDLLGSSLAATNLASARTHWQAAFDIYRNLAHRLGAVLSEWLETIDRVPEPDLIEKWDDARRRHARRLV